MTVASLAVLDHRVIALGRYMNTALQFYRFTIVCWINTIPFWPDNFPQPTTVHVLPKLTYLSSGIKQIGCAVAGRTPNVYCIIPRLILRAFSDVYLRIVHTCKIDGLLQAKQGEIVGKCCGVVARMFYHIRYVVATGFMSAKQLIAIRIWLCIIFTNEHRASKYENGLLLRYYCMLRFSR